jgi:hypothetical protein
MNFYCVIMTRSDQGWPWLRKSYITARSASVAMTAAGLQEPLYRVLGVELDDRG